MTLFLVIPPLWAKITERLNKLIVHDGKNSHYLDFNFPQQLSTGICDVTGFQLWQVLDPLGVIISEVLIKNAVSLLFSLKSKQKHSKSSLTFHRVLFQRSQQTKCRPSSKRLTSSCCLIFVFTSYWEASRFNCACNEAKWKHFLGRPFRDEANTNTFYDTDVKMKQGKPLII